MRRGSEKLLQLLSISQLYGTNIFILRIRRLDIIIETQVNNILLVKRFNPNNNLFT